MAVLPMLPASTDQPIRVLVAEPDPTTRAIYRALLGTGEELVETVDGREALVRALMKPPALVITELQLPYIDGVALCEILRRDRTTAHTPVLVVTKPIGPIELERARRAGANAVLAKPCTLPALRQEIDRLLQTSRELLERSVRARAASMSEVERTARLLAHVGGALSPALSKAHQRFTTTTPPTAAPVLQCPICDEPLRYEYSHVGGVSAVHPEQWDYYMCSQCGPFQYRQRTRKLRRVS